MAVIYDQTKHGNDLLPATPAINNPAYDNPVNASRHPVTVFGHTVYGAYFETGMGYRAQNTTAIARGNDPETIYMVTSGTHANAMCCFDYGQSENSCDDPKAFCDGCMESVYFGTGYGGKGKGNWIGADLENGIYGGPYVDDEALRSPFVTAMVKGGTNGFVVKGADATGAVAGGKLKRMFDGPRPAGYQPMRKTGAVILGVGGDNAEARGVRHGGVRRSRARRSRAREPQEGHAHLRQMQRQRRWQRRRRWRWACRGCRWGHFTKGC